MDMEEQSLSLEDLIGKGHSLPSLPEIYIRVSQQLNDESTNADSIAETVKNDPAISSRILKMVNSAYYGLPKQVASMSQAVSLLGRECLRQMLIGSVLKAVFNQQDNPAFSMQEFWQHSIKTAIIARSLATEIAEIEEIDAMFTAGLLHDVGKLVMFDKMPEKMLAAEEWMIRNRVDIESAEKEVIGFTHTEVSEALMQHWSLPSILIDCARNHHSPDHQGEHRHETHLIYLANQLSQFVPPMDEGETGDILNEIENWSMNKLSLQSIAHACQQADDQVFEVMESLGMIPMEIIED